MRPAENSFGPRPVVYADPRDWRGVRCVVVGIVLLALGVGCTAAGQGNRGEGPALAALPKEVRAAVDRAAQVYHQPLSGARWSEVYLLGGTEHRLFQLQGTNSRGNKIELEVTGAGRIIEVEEHGIPISEVPGAVLEALQAKMPNFKPTHVEAIYQAELVQPVSYGFEAQDAAGGKTEVYISADGKTFLN